MELFEIGEDNIFKSQFDSKKDPIEIWKTAVFYHCLRQHARRILSCFGSTYCCEATFSYMTQIKNRLRSKISDVPLKDQLKLRTTSIEPNIYFLSSNKNHRNPIKLSGFASHVYPGEKRQSQTFTKVCLDHGVMINESCTPTSHSGNKKKTTD
ncbi:GTF2IRD2B [Cordylochernes scorpioides]|uniref:GTF2IRD2B n=1 Tax=Cordylochernes scorpioides TaxID=51811 RepID=A0ABY6KPK8_9ARAC|nr:GTF2IRD2B [Cordylochernes scorpioides]